MSFDYAKKISLIVNTVILGLVIVLMGFFAICKAHILVYFSIPTIALYLLNYILIAKGKLASFIRFVYFWIVLYMELTTVCLGFNCGFHLYALSLIPVIFCSEYMGYKLETKSIRPGFVSVVIAIMYIVGTIISVKRGAIYEVNGTVATIMLVFNAIVVFSFLITYTSLLLKMVINSETELKKIAHLDKLTGLYNRHYLMNKLNSNIDRTTNDAWLAMIDIDNFKRINDNDGHNSGDYVLHHLAELLTDVCEGCVVARWGGEEFIVLSENNKSAEIIEEVRSRIASAPFEYDGKSIVVTITAGVSHYENDMSVDEWIKSADNKMYEGKRATKNVVIY